MAISGEWVRVAPELAFQQITALAVFDNGSGDQIYGMTYKTPDKGGRLFRWNDVDAWGEVAPYVPPYNLTSLGQGLVEFNSKLYGATGHFFFGGGCRLLEWNSIDAWSVVATRYALHQIGDLIVFDDGGGDALYAVSSDGFGGSAKLMKWNGVDTLDTVANWFLNQTWCFDLCEYKGDLFGAMAPDGLLFKWNKVDAWIKVADQLNGQTSIRSLAVFDNGSGDALFGGTSPDGKLFRFNDVDAWEEVADQLNGQTYIDSLLVYNGKLHGGTGTRGRLFQWNDSDAWIELAPKLISAHISDLVEYKGEIFGSTTWFGSLLKYIPAESEDHRFITAVNDRIYQQFF